MSEDADTEQDLKPADGLLDIMKMHIDQAGQMAGYSGMALEEAGRMFRAGFSVGKGKRARDRDAPQATEAEEEG